MLNKFLVEYETQLLMRYAWAAQDPKRLGIFMQSCMRTLTGNETTWNHDGEAVAAAWQALGFNGKPTLKALRELNIQ